MWWWCWWWSGWSAVLAGGGGVPAAPGAACAALCSCRADHLACSHVPYHRLPPTEAGVRHVSVSGARLGVLSEASLDARPLRTLVLVASRLHHIECEALASMGETLASLDLGYNEFIQVPIEALRELKVLNWLNLQNNYISEVDVDMEWGSLGESLSSLSLASNQLVWLGAGALTGLRQLAHLDLDGNRLVVVESSALPDSLAVLRLTDNLLPALPCAALATLPRLRQLHIRSNALRSSSNATCLVELLKVDSLDLSRNEIDDRFTLNFQPRLQLKQIILDLNQFTSVPSFVAESGRLEKLSMSYNRLGHVSAAMLHALRHDLERLELDHNELRTAPGGLRNLLRLRHLSLAYNYLRELEHLPPHIHFLAVAGNYFQTFPGGLWQLAAASLVYLDLGYNQISTLAMDTFGPWAGALATLNLRGNRISHLTTDCFPANLPLRELVLSFNDLYYMHGDTFFNLTMLQMLELSTTLFNGEFPLTSAPETITWLSLDNNNIRYVTSEDLHKLLALEYLNLDFNKLTDFPSKMTAPNDSTRVLNLKELRLSYNYINKVDCDFLGKLNELQSLDLTSNRVNTVRELCFVNLPNLAYLSFSGNVIERVERAAFSRLWRLEALDLQHNLLTEFSTESFDRVSAENRHLSVNASYNRIYSLLGGAATVYINCLDLSHNMIKSLPRAFFDSLGPHITQIILSHNRLLAIDNDGLGTLLSLQILNLNNNNITVVKRKAFTKLSALQMLDLSHNNILQLTVEQFHGLRRLRHLRLNDNELRTLPRDCFKYTIVEDLDLSGNRFTIFPSTALAQVGFTLRRLQMAGNWLEHLDAAMFHATTFLHDLDVANNALTALADNTLVALSRLYALDLSGNKIKANFKELFHAVPRLRRLALAGTGLRVVPPLPLADLVELDLAGNTIAAYHETDIRRLRALRSLRLDDNQFTSLRPAMWTALPHLVDLNVSGNPVVRISHGSFEGLPRLQRLWMERLRHVETVEPRAFRALLRLRSLALDSPLTAAGNALPGDAVLAKLVRAMPTLEALSLVMRSKVLDSQLAGVRGPRLRELEVRGVSLRRVSSHAFAALADQRSLTIRMRQTSVAELPAGLLRPLTAVPHLTLDFSDNRLVGFSPDILYPNHTGWDRYGTKLLPGGLMLSGNELACGCGVWWVAAWLRRWTAEVGGGGRGAARAAATSACVTASARRPLVAVQADRASCRARALASRAQRRRACKRSPAFLWIVLLYSIS